MKPMMREHQIRLIEEALLGLGRDRLDILEWGCGGSTVHFTRFLRAHGVSYAWLSIEHDREWQQTVEKELAGDPGAKVQWIAGGTTKDNWRGVPMDDYVNHPRSLNRQFDFILVDGRKRRRCLLEARRLVRPGGVVFLHDAQRSYYHCAFGAFTDSRFLDRELWRGRVGPVALARRMSNGFNRFYFCQALPFLESLRRAKLLKRLARLFGYRELP